MLAVHYFWEDLFWKKKNAQIEWLENLYPGYNGQAGELPSVVQGG